MPAARQFGRAGAESRRKNGVRRRREFSYKILTGASVNTFAPSVEELGRRTHGRKKAEIRFVGG